MRFITIILASLLFLITVSCAKYSEKQVAANYHAVIVVAALEEMYWLEYNKIFTKEELDLFDTNIQAEIENSIKTRLTPELVERIKQLRKDAQYDY